MAEDKEAMELANRAEQERAAKALMRATKKMMRKMAVRRKLLFVRRILVCGLVAALAVAFTVSGQMANWIAQVLCGGCLVIGAIFTDRYVRKEDE